jgi:hypothetical protein
MLAQSGDPGVRSFSIDWSRSRQRCTVPNHAGAPVCQPVAIDAEGSGTVPGERAARANGNLEGGRSEGHRRCGLAYQSMERCRDGKCKSKRAKHETSPESRLALGRRDWEG